MTKSEASLRGFIVYSGMNAARPFREEARRWAAEVFTGSAAGTLMALTEQREQTLALVDMIARFGLASCPHAAQPSCEMCIAEGLAILAHAVPDLCVCGHDMAMHGPRYGGPCSAIRCGHGSSSPERCQCALFAHDAQKGGT